MKKTILIGTAALIAGSLLAADPKDDVKSAVKKLADAGNYSWTTALDFGGGGFDMPPSEGKVDKDGIALVTSTFGENTMETVFKGTNSATKNPEGTWQTPAERAAAGGGRGRGGFGGMFGGQTLPTAQAEDLLSKVKELKLADGVYSGDLTEEGAKALMSFGGRRGGPAPEITGAKGTVKFWVKDGALTKYVFTRQGSVSRGGGDPMEMNLTTTVEIKNVGTTKLTIPDEAKKKVS